MHKKYGLQPYNLKSKILQLMIKVKRILIILFIFINYSFQVKSQSTEKLEDTLTTKPLDPIFVNTYSKNAAPKYIAEVVGMNIYSGKKTNQVYLDASGMNLAQKCITNSLCTNTWINHVGYGRAGLQINVGSRGTDSHRSIEMNMRQNGYNINSDMFGYPGDHYTSPLQAVQQVQLVRGSAALQFGSQFGGMMNYIMKEADSTKTFSYTGEQTNRFKQLF